MYLTIDNLHAINDVTKVNTRSFFVYFTIDRGSQRLFSLKAKFPIRTSSVMDQSAAEYEKNKSAPASLTNQTRNE